MIPRRISGLTRLLLTSLCIAIWASFAVAQPPAPSGEVARLMGVLDDPDPVAQEAAALALGRLGPTAAPATDRLIATFAQTDLYVRGAAAVALGHIGAPAVPALSRALEHSSRDVRCSAGIALGRIGHDAIAAVPALTRAATDVDDDVRYVAIVALGVLGPAAETACPIVTGALHDRVEHIRAAARLALRQIDPAAAARRRGLAAVTATINQLVPALMKELRVPGVSVALVQDRHIVWSDVYGVANATTNTPVRRDTAFEAASMSKPIFALLTMPLVERGQLALDRPFANQAEGGLVPNHPERRTITPRMALTHTTGYPNWRPVGEERESPLPLLFVPGTRYGYSGEGIFALQRAVESLTNMPLDKLAQTRLFEPLGLRHTSYAWTPAIGATQATGHSDDGTVRTTSKYMHPNAAYTLYTTAEEYARLLIETMNAARGASTLLTAASANEMLRRQIELNGTDPIERPGNTGAERVFRGLGWAITSAPGGDIVHHGGSNGTGFRSFAQFCPTRGSALVILTNGSQGGDLWTRVVAAIGDF